MDPVTKGALNDLKELLRDRVMNGARRSPPYGKPWHLLRFRGIHLLPSCLHLSHGAHLPARANQSASLLSRGAHLRAWPSARASRPHYLHGQPGRITG